MVLIVFNGTIAAIVMKVYLSVAEISNVTKMAKTTVLRCGKTGWLDSVRRGVSGVNGYRDEW